MAPNAFHLFPRLPIELRHKTLTFALQIPTLVPLIFTAEDPMGWDMHLVSRSIPPLLHSSHESRLLTLKNYPTPFTLPGSKLQVYVNFDIDTVMVRVAISFRMPLDFKGGKGGSLPLSLLYFMLISENPGSAFWDSNRIFEGGKD